MWSESPPSISSVTLPSLVSDLSQPSTHATGSRTDARRQTNHGKEGPVLTIFQMITTTLAVLSSRDAYTLAYNHAR